MAAPGVRLLGLVDANAAALGTVDGLPVVAPAELAYRPAAGVLIRHPNREAELSGVLAACAPPGRWVELLYGGPGFAAFCRRPEIREAALEGLGPHIRHVVVRAPRSGVIVDDAALADVLPAAETVILHASLEAERIDSRVYPVKTLHGSLVLLDEAVRRIQPRTVLLQFNLNAMHLAAHVRRLPPQVPVVVELWDLWRVSVGNLRAEDQARLFAMTEEELRLNQQEEAYALNAADLLITKWGGRLWKATARDFGAPCLPYFARTAAASPLNGSMASPPDEAPASPPDATGTTVPPSRRSEPLRLIFASTMQLPAVLAQLDYVREDQDHCLGMKTLAAGGRRITLSSPRRASVRFSPPGCRCWSTPAYPTPPNWLRLSTPESSSPPTRMSRRRRGGFWPPPTRNGIVAAPARRARRQQPPDPGRPAPTAAKQVGVSYTQNSREFRNWVYNRAGF